MANGDGGAPRLHAVELVATEGSDMPFAALEEWPDEESGSRDHRSSIEDDLRASLRGSGVSFRSHQPESTSSRLRRTVRSYMLSSQDQGLQILQLLTCNVMSYFYGHLSPRNIIFLMMSAGVFSSTWLSLEPSVVGWALGVLYVFSATSRVGTLEPLWAGALTVSAQVAFDVAPHGGTLRVVLWRSLAVIGALSEVCWWPSSNFLIDSSFHGWIVHFSTYYAVIIDFWVWPQLLQIDLDKWHITKVISQAPDDTKDAIFDLSAGLLLIIGIPLLACTVIAIIILWNRNPRLCIMITVVYIALISLLIIFQNASLEQAADIGEVPIAIIFIALAREQLTSTFDDYMTWRAQAVLLASFIFLRRVARLFFDSSTANQVQVIVILIFQIFSKQWMAAQCCAVHLGLPSSWCLAAWVPRRSGMLLGSDELYGPRVVLERPASLPQET